MRSGWRLVPGLAALAVLAATGCATMPDSGAVHEVSAGRANGQQDPHVRVFALPPQENEDPATIVDGFLEALTSDEAGFDTARQYLTKKAQETWQPDAGTVIFGRKPESPITQQSKDTVELSADEVARVDPSGLYQPAAPGQKFNAKFELTQVKGQWRIASLPPGVYVSEFDFQRLYRPLSLYFFDPERRMLVPDPVYLPARPGQIAAAVRALVRGPSSLLGSAVVSDFPRGTTLVGDTVPTEGGVPHVRLNGAALAADAKAREGMAAQLVWTLAQFGYKEVRITAEGGDFAPGSAPETRSRQEFARYDPGARAGDLYGYYQQDGKLMRVLGKPPGKVAGPFGTARPRYRSFAVSPTTDEAAGVTEDGTRLFVSGLVDGASAALRLSGRSLSTPSWDGEGRIWVADKTPTGSQIWMIPRKGAPERVDATELAGADIRALRVARDGTRLAMLVTSEGKTGLRVARIERHPKGSGTAGSGGARPSEAREPAQASDNKVPMQFTVAGVRRIAETLVDVRDLSWSGLGQLTVLGENRDGVPLPFQVNFDGSALEAGLTGPGKALTAVSAAPGQQLLVATDDDAVWQRAPERWVKIDDNGKAPFYPG